MNNTITITQERYDQLLAAEKALAELMLRRDEKSAFAREINAKLDRLGARLTPLDHEAVYNILGDDSV